MKLHGYFRSSASYRVRIALNLKGLGADHLSHHLRKGEQRDPAYLAINPQGLVPALQDDAGGILTQSLGGGFAFMPISPHIGAEDLAVPSRWLLCSDGLSDMLDLDEIEHAMAAADEEAGRALFLQAMDAGGDDNISIIVMSVEASVAASIAPGAT